MKLIVLFVVSIAVFKASCRELPDGRDLTNGERVQHGTELRGKKGGSKCKSDIVCSLLGGSCVTNSTYCSGREVPSVCSGTTCKCCIPVTLEVKVHDLETELRAMVANLTVENLNQRTEMNTMMNLLISNLTVANANMLDLMISSNKSLTIANSNIQNELEVIKSNITRANANQVSKLDSIKEGQGCPKGLFLYAPSNQCFKLLNDTTRTWDTGNAACRALGLQMAQPYEPVGLRNYMVTRFASSWIWLGARGDGSYIRWQRTRQALTSSNPLFWSGLPSSYVSKNNCLTLMTSESNWKSQATSPYYNANSCTSRYWTLCELVRE